MSRKLSYRLLMQHCDTWRCRSPYLVASVLTVMGFLILGLLCKLIWPGSFGKHLLTTTISAQTEVLSFVTGEDQEQSWGLPPGTVSLIGVVDSEDCVTNGIESRCHLTDSSLIQISGLARIELLTAPTGGWQLNVRSVDESDTDVRLFDQHARELVHSAQLLQFEVDRATSPVRLPFVARSSVVGGDLHHSTTLAGSELDFWQPVLRSGDVTMIADNKPGREKYRVLTEKLDSGDVVHVGSPDNDTIVSDQNLVWGMVSIAHIHGIDDGTLIRGLVLDVIVHTSLQELTVTRFGAPGGHIIKASAWTIKSQWPNAQLTWVAFLSIILVTGFVLQLGQSMPRLLSGSKTGHWRESQEE